MESWCCLFTLLLSVLLTTTTAITKCPLNQTTPGISCICDDIANANGWSFTCLDFEFENLYAVRYVVDHSLTFVCGIHEPQYQSIFHQLILSLNEIQTFAFKWCPLPNVSFSEIIPYREKYPVEQIKIEAKRDNLSLTTELFGNISSTLKSLILSDNKIDVLPENLFTNFTVLKYLSLSNNKLRSVPKDLFSNVGNLVILELPNNGLESLPEGVFRNLHLLEKLYLYKNQLKELPNDVFKNLTNLKVLDLADNHLMLLPDEIFLGLPNLAHIRLRANWLMTISKDLFNSSWNLKAVDISLNRFMEPLPEELLFGLAQLENVIISNCNLSELHENFFSRNPNLTFVDLERNRLTNLPQNIFLNNSLVKEINLNFNNLQALPFNLFSNQMHLEKLSLFKNDISVIPDGLFKRARKIKALELGRNRLQNASQTIFRDLPDLEILNLKDNNLTHFELDTNEFIKRVDLSNNSFTKMPSIQWTRHLRMEEFNLERNKISNLSIPILYSSNNKSPILNIANNDIKTVSTEGLSLNDIMLKDLPSKDYDNYVETRIILNNNPFLCDCQIYNFYKYVKYSTSLPKKSARFDAVHDLTCHEPSNLAGKQIMSLSPNQFTCELREQCSFPCHCYTRAQDNANIVNCSYHNLKKLPSEIPNNTKVLLFQKNMLSNMDGFNSTKWENLTELYLEGNDILSLDEWKIPSKLTNLSLEGNHVRHLPSSLMEFISNAQHFQITLSNNPWSCNCSTINFKKWLAEHFLKVKDVKKVMCANRLKWNGTLNRTPILTTPDDIICPIDNWPYKLHLITVTVICAVLALLLFIVSVLYYRNKQTVIAYVYIHMHTVFTCFFSEEDIDEDKIFDAFVSYSSSDSEVALKLIEELEEKEPRFRLCIHERNWIAGNPISWNIINSVHNSKRTILVISKQFLESMWFQVEFRTAYYQMLEDKIDRLIIIVKGELPPRDTMDRDFQNLLSTKTYLVWEEKWFWEKLKYAMPHKRQQILPNDVLALKDRPASEKIRSVDNQIAILSSGGNKTTDKVQEVIQNHTNGAMTMVKKDTTNWK